VLHIILTGVGGTVYLRRGCGAGLCVLRMLVVGCPWLCGVCVAGKWVQVLTEKDFTYQGVVAVIPEEPARSLVHCV
jgi:hypothetical protein